MRIQLGGVAVGLLLLLSLGAGCARTDSQTPSAVKEEAVVTHRAEGSFEVKLNPEATDENAGGPSVGRMLIDKQFHGDLEATSKGQMLMVMAAVKGSGGYVAMEQVQGSLHGLSGAFALQHSGTMAAGTQELIVTVVPDSGTEELLGLAGTMTIDIVDGEHLYVFEYSLAESH